MPQPNPTPNIPLSAAPAPGLEAPLSAAARPLVLFPVRLETRFFDRPLPFNLRKLLPADIR